MFSRYARVPGHQRSVVAVGRFDSTAAVIVSAESHKIARSADKPRFNRKNNKQLLLIFNGIAVGFKELKVL